MTKAIKGSKKVKLPWIINVLSAVAVYEQIENQVRFAMSAGKLGANDQLPSVRELSEILKVNPNTVAKAYRDLEVMGYLYTRRGMGIFIKEGAPSKARKEVANYINKRVTEVAREAGAANLPESDLVATFRRNVKLGQKEPIYL